MKWKKIFQFIDLIKLIYWKKTLGKLGPGSRIFNNVVIKNPKNLYMETKSYIYDECFLAIGKNSKIIIGSNSHLGVRVYCNCSDCNLYIGNDVAIGPYTQIYTYSNSYEIGKIYHNCYKIADIYIGNNVFIGAGVIILPGVKIGDNSVIGAGSIVNKNIPANVLAYGQPISIIKELKK